MKTAGLIVVQETINDAMHQENQASKGEKDAVLRELHPSTFMESYTFKANLRAQSACELFCHC